MNLTYIALIILGIVVLLLITEWLPNWMIGIGIILAMLLFGILGPGDIVGQFTSPTLLMILSIFVLGEALFQTGIAEIIGKKTADWATKNNNNEKIIIGVVMIMAAALSSLLSNLGVAAVFIPVVLTIARYTKISRTKLLISLAVSSTMGGMLTLAGSPPQLSD